jgi:hypothetical protein
MEPVDITGKRFGRLVAISLDHTTKYSKGYVQHWLCRCDCGATKIVAKPALTRGATVSCGCYAREKASETGRKRSVDITGKKFERLTAIKFDHHSEYGEYWLCKCDCGNETIVLKANLGRVVKSCGCLGREAAKTASQRRNIDISGKKFGRLTAIRIDHVAKANNGQTVQYWLCKCDCGTEKVIMKYHLGKSIFSCGCLLRENARNRFRTHGDTKTSLYHRWMRMKERCYNKNHQAYHLYGGRGINVCDDWLIYENFKKWALANGYKEDLQIDRIDNDGNYCPENCRFTGSKEQAVNRRTTKFIEYNGERLSYADWSLRLGSSRNIVEKRIAAGWNEIDAITLKPKRGKRKHGG